MGTIKAGYYRIKDNPLNAFDETSTMVINFTSDGKSFSVMQVSSRWSSSEGTFYTLDYSSPSYKVCSFSVKTGETTFYDEALRSIYIATDQNLSDSNCTLFNKRYDWLGFIPSVVDTRPKPVYERENGVWSKKTAYEMVGGQWEKVSESDD